jgi:hypothetical protein
MWPPRPPELLRHLINVDTEAIPAENAEIALVRNPNAEPGDPDEWLPGTVLGGATYSMQPPLNPAIGTMWVSASGQCIDENGDFT